MQDEEVHQQQHDDPHDQRHPRDERDVHQAAASLCATRRWAATMGASRSVGIG
jgi:hypothetical protein